jgi:hypothetical protein
MSDRTSSGRERPAPRRRKRPRPADTRSGATDLGNDSDRDESRGGTLGSGDRQGMEAGIDPRATDLGDDGERPA